MKSLTTTRIKWLLVTVLLPIVVGTIALLWFWPWSPPKDPPLRVFSGDSAGLSKTVVLPTLDTPIPKGKSTVWCASFQLAWNQLKGRLAKGPVQLSGAQEIADRLNWSQVSEEDLIAGEYCVDAGRAEDNIQNQIAQNLGAKFPGHTMPALPALEDGGTVAFGYLRSEVRYKYYFFDNRQWLYFRDAGGSQTRVRSFGLPERKGDPILGDCRKQVEVLFRDGWQFALDLSSETKPHQVVLAKMDRKDDLAQTLADLNDRIAKGKRALLTDSATLLIPNTDWRVEHRFRELEGFDKKFGNKPLEGHFLEMAYQFIDMKMDRHGAAVESGAFVASALLNGHDEHKEDANPDHFHFDRPFLLVLKKRGAVNPFFVMWVDNAELLCRR